MNNKTSMEYHEVIVVGAGMCGISCGAALKTFDVEDFVILEKGNTINNFWKNHTYDRMTLHTPYHDLPFDGGLVYNYPQMKDKHELTEYMIQYASKYKLMDHIRFESEIISIEKSQANNEWILSLQNGLCYTSKYLCLATSALSQPMIPRSLTQTSSNFKSKNGIIHSMQYKNGEKYRNENVLVIGNGDSAFEIAVDLVSYGAQKVTLISPMARHVVRLSHLNRTLYRLFGLAKKLGMIDILFKNIFHVTPNHPKWNLRLLSLIFCGLDALSLDLSEYGMKKPSQSVFECNVNGILQVLDWPGEHSAVDLIKSRRIEYICDLVMRFDEPNLIKLQRDNRILSEYHSVILCTGYKHGLQSIFPSEMYDGLFDNNKPKTNAYNQSTQDETLFFVGLLGDYSLLSGFANGWWGYHCGRTIAKQKGVYDAKKEPSTWNSYTLKNMSMFTISCGLVIAASSYLTVHLKKWRTAQ